jgi:hypothetical protein
MGLYALFGKKSPKTAQAPWELKELWRQTRIFAGFFEKAQGNLKNIGAKGAFFADFF